MQGRRPRLLPQSVMRFVPPSFPPGTEPSRERVMNHNKYLQNVLFGATAVLFAGSTVSSKMAQSGPVLETASAIMHGRSLTASTGNTAASAKIADPTSPLAEKIDGAVTAFKSLANSLSSPKALEDAFGSYFAYKAAHPNDVKKPYLYFVDYGLPSTTPRGYVFNMDALSLVDGPFTVAHGKGSSTSRYGVPTNFSNASRSSATSLGLYVTKALYAFTGHSGGQAYHSVGLRLDGVSKGFNDNALARGVVAHGAPYVTPSRAGRSQGCPAMEQARAKELLPKLADGAMVFLYAPNSHWENNDPWIAAADEN